MNDDSRDVTPIRVERPTFDDGEPVGGAWRPRGKAPDGAAIIVICATLVVALGAYVGWVARLGQ